MGGGLVELHSVLVFIDQTNGASNRIYGEVKIAECTGHVFDIFKEDKDNAKTISVDGILPLTGPPRCIINPFDFAIGVSLKEMHQDLEVSQGHLALSHGARVGWYNRPVRAVIQGDHGYTVLHLSLFSDAVQATVEVVFVTTGDIRRHQHTVHGNIVAKYSKYEYKGDYAKKYHQTMMFNVPQDRPLELPHMAQDDESIEEKIVIPLSRSVVAVPSWSNLLIEANLCDNIGNDIQESSFEVVSVGGIASFYAVSTANGEITEVIEGKNGRIEVKVTWLADVLGSIYSAPFPTSEGESP